MLDPFNIVMNTLVLRYRDINEVVNTFRQVGESFNQAGRHQYIAVKINRQLKEVCIIPVEDKQQASSFKKICWLVDFILEDMRFNKSTHLSVITSSFTKITDAYAKKERSWWSTIIFYFYGSRQLQQAEGLVKNLNKKTVFFSGWDSYLQANNFYSHKA